MTAVRQMISGCLLLVTVSSGSGIASPSHDDVIVPGHKIGKVALHRSRQAIHTLLGKPRGTYPLPHDLLGDYWQGHSGHTVRVFYHAHKVIQVSVTSPSFATAEGLTVTSSLEEVQRQYTKLKKFSYAVPGSGGGVIEYYDDVEQGIAFAFTSRALAPVHVTLYAIMVHRSGHKVIAEPDEKLQ